MADNDSSSLKQFMIVKSKSISFKRPLVYNTRYEVNVRLCWSCASASSFETAPNTPPVKRCWGWQSSVPSSDNPNCCPWSIRPWGSRITSPGPARSIRHPSTIRPYAWCCCRWRSTASAPARMGSTVTGDVSVTGVVTVWSDWDKGGSVLMNQSWVLACHMYQVLQQAIKWKILVPPNKKGRVYSHRCVSHCLSFKFFALKF